jgi:hypothetical protein
VGFHLSRFTARHVYNVINLAVANKHELTAVISNCDSCRVDVYENLSAAVLDENPRSVQQVFGVGRGFGCQARVLRQLAIDGVDMRRGMLEEQRDMLEERSSLRFWNARVQTALMFAWCELNAACIAQRAAEKK